MGKRFFVFVACLAVGIFLITVGSSVSYACKCVELPSIEEEFEQSDAVFSGKVIAIKEGKENSTGSRSEKILFEVSSTWKGPKESQIILEFYESSCSIIFKKGKEYLVYASKNPEFKNKAVLTSQLCDRTVEVSKAKEDLTFLGNGDSPVKQVNLQKEMGPSVPVRSLLLWMPVIGVAVLVGWFIWKGSKQ